MNCALISLFCNSHFYPSLIGMDIASIWLTCVYGTSVWLRSGEYFENTCLFKDV